MPNLLLAYFVADDLHWPEPLPLASAAVEGSYVGCFGVPVPVDSVIAGLAAVAVVVAVVAAAAVAVAVAAEPCASARAAHASTEPDRLVGSGTWAVPGNSAAELVASAADGLECSAAHVHLPAFEPLAWARTGFVPYDLVGQEAVVSAAIASAVAVEV